MKRLLQLLIRHIAFKYGRATSLWYPTGEEWAAWLKRHGGLNAIGKHCSIQRNVVITDPAYVRVGNNVRLSGCTLFGHDGSVNMLNRAYGLRLDHVGKIDIRDNVFIGHNSVILPGVTIGPNSVVAAGAVVSADVLPHSVYGGVPARRICAIDDLLSNMTQRSNNYPWIELVEARREAFDAAMEPELIRQRVAHFFPVTCEA